MEPGALLQKLVEAGVTPRDGTPAALDAAVREFQRSHGLSVDGVVGPKTAAALLSPPGSAGCIRPGWRYDRGLVRPELLPVLEAARREIGTRESPPHSNRGPRVDVYTRPDLGEPWCAALVSWCYARRVGGSPFGRILSTRALVAWGEAHGCLLPPGAPLEPGDVFFIPTAPGRGHVGLVCYPSADGQVDAIEGNHGDAVWGWWRERATIPTFVRPA